MHVLILCNDFPPLNSVAAQRPYSWALYLPEEGIRTTVVAKDWTSELPTLAAPGSLDQGPLDPGCAEVLRVPHRLLPSRRLARRVGDTLSGLRRALTFVEHASGFVSLGLDRHAHLYRKARDLLKDRPADWVVTTAEPFVLFRYGALLKREFGIRWLADYRDAWHQSHVGRYDRRPAARALRLWEALFERRFLRSADHITTVDPECAAELSTYHRRPVTTIYNGFWDFYSGPLPATDPSTLVVTHGGTLTDGQQAELLLDAVREILAEGSASSAEIRLQFLGLEAQPRQVLRVRGRLAEASSSLVTTARLPQKEALARCAASDVLISLTDPRVRAIYAKTYEYIAARRPTLVVPDDHSILSELVRTARIGSPVADKAELKAVLLRFLEEKRRSGKVASVATDESFARRFTRRDQAHRLARLLTSASGD